MISQVESGVAFAIAGIVALAGILKITGPETLVTSLTRLLPGTDRVSRLARTPLAVRSFGLIEIALAVAFALVRGWPGVAVGAAVTALCVSFVLVLRRAIRLGVSCGCFGRLGQTSTGGRELGRAVSMSIASCLAVGLLLAQVRPGLVVGRASIVTAVATFGLVILGMTTGEATWSRWRGVGTGASRQGAQGRKKGGPSALLAAAVGLDNGVFAARAPMPLTELGPPGRRLEGGYLESAVSVLRASHDLPLMLAHLEKVGCSAPRWDLADAAEFVATEERAASIFIQVPLEPGCLMMASIDDGGKAGALVGCHSNTCAGVSEGRVLVGS